MERICRNCRLYNPAEGVCGVTVVIKGEHYELPVLAGDACHWERVDREVQEDLDAALAARRGQRQFQAKLEAEADTPIEVKQVRMWSDGKNGYIEYPADQVKD